MRRQRDQVGSVGDRERAKPLHRVAQHQRAGLVRQRGELGDRLDHADLVVDQHRRDQRGALVDRRFGGWSRSTSPSGPTGKADDIEALSFEPFGGVEHRGMFGGDGDELAPLGPLERALDRPVDRFGRAAGEGEAALVRPIAVSDPVARDLDRRRGLAPPARRAVRVGELLLDPRPHRRRDFGRDRRRRLIIEIDHAALGRSRSAMRRHSARKASTSASLVCGPKLMRRIAAGDIVAATPIAASTWLAFILPDEQALPADTAIPARSSWTSSAALDAPGSAIAPMVGDARAVLADDDPAGGVDAVLEPCAQSSRAAAMS